MNRQSVSPPHLCPLWPRECRWASAFIALLAASASGVEPPRTLPTVQKMAASHRDIWGEAAVRQPGGPSFEFFKDLLPPLRYANTEFRHYPIVLSAPLAPVKARWISNGSAVNARANKKPMWREVGFPVHFSVGDEKPELFGTDPERMDGPRYARGYLPIIQIAYRHGGMTYEQEAFASVRNSLAARGAVFVRFTARGNSGTVTAHVDIATPLKLAGTAIVNDKGEALVMFDSGWQWDGATKQLRRRMESGGIGALVVLTEPLPPPLPVLFEHVQERQECAAAWEALLERGIKMDVPELVVNNAWKACVIGNFLIAVGDRMHYSAGNAYDHLYEAECGDATRALMLFGHTDSARRMVGPLLDFNRQATRFHVAGHKLQLLNHYYWVTRDAEYMNAKRPVWKGVVDFIISSRQKSNGLLPPDRYAGDIATDVYALNSNANCWRGLRDLSAVLADLGEQELSRQLVEEAKSFRQAILAAVARSERRDVQPPFIPNALFGAEQPYETLTATRMGSYYDLMCPYIIGSGVFGPGSEREAWMIEYLQQHGGLAMGMIRTTPQQGEFKGYPGVNVLYGLRFVLALLQRDDRDRALTGFYGQLAQGMTRDTFIGGEGSRFWHGDRWGRSFYLPPNSASNAKFLTTLRYLLVQDWDTDDDGKPDTLRLLYGAPGRWLKDGATLTVERAPTMFGLLSFKAESRLQKGEVLVTVDSPPRRPARTWLRVPLPIGWKVVSAGVADEALTLANDGAVDLSSRTGRYTVRFKVEALK